MDGETGEEEHQSRGVGSGFGDGYDFGAPAGTGESLFEGISNEAAAGIAVEAYTV